MFDFSLPPTIAVLPIEGHDVVPPNLLHAPAHSVVTLQVFAIIGDTPPPSNLVGPADTLIMQQVFLINGDAPPPPPN
jgi:hypothetical protein